MSILIITIYLIIAGAVGMAWYDYDPEYMWFCLLWPVMAIMSLGASVTYFVIKWLASHRNT